MEEIVLLVTGAALYPVRFDWDTEKVISFERIGLESLQRLRKGAYITSTLTAAKLDPARNVGLVVSYRPAPQHLIRINTRSMSTVEAPEIPNMEENDGARETTEKENEETNAAASEESATSNLPSSPEKTTDAKPKSPTRTAFDIRLIAFKALPVRSSVASTASRDGATHQLSEQELVTDIVEHIATAVAQLKDDPKEAGQTKPSEIGADAKAPTDGTGFQVEEGDIISATEAKRSTGLLEQWGYTLKKFVWA